MLPRNKSLESQPESAKAMAAHRETRARPVPDPGDGFLRDGYWLANCAGWTWNTPAPDTCEAIRKAATTAGTLMSLRN